jgi:hypothetical protein
MDGATGKRRCAIATAAKLAFAPEPMLPPIVVDLGPHVTPTELAYVLAACNEVVATGACLPKGEATLVAPRALAIAKRAERVVEIEVRLSGSEQPPLVRTLSFTQEDPPRERWRSVGLAIATLVGEGQRAEAAVQAAREAESPGSTVEPAETEPAETEPAETEPRAPVAADDLPAAVHEGAQVPRQGGVFVGLGVFGGPALDDGSGRVGASLRGGWLSRAGIMVLGSASYSVRAVSDDPIDVSWLAFEAGLGHRFWLSDELSLGLSARAGVQRLRFEASSGSAIQSRSVLNPVGTLSIEGGWLPWRGFGVWLALEAHSGGRRSELFVADTLALSTYPVDVTGLLGIHWLIH